MSTANENNITVSINEEYDRILSNPDGLIMSDGLAERLEGEWDLAGALKDLENNTSGESATAEAAPAIDRAVSSVSPEKNSIRVFTDENPNEALVYCEVQSFNSMQDAYTLGVIVRGDQKRFMNTLMKLQTSSNDNTFGIDVAGRNGFIALNVDITSWSFTKTNSYDTNLTISFGSDHVEF